MAVRIYNPLDLPPSPAQIAILHRGVYVDDAPDVLMIKNLHLVGA
jgi:hypothetical protein